MLANLVWLFPAHRQLHAENTRLAAELAEAHRIIGSGKLFNLEEAMASYNETVLQEKPWPDNRVPDDAWLTPGDNR